MTKQKEIREGVARRMFDSEMSATQCFGVATREKVWEEEKEEWLARAYNDLHWLASQGVVIKVERELPEPEDVNEEPEVEFVQGWCACENEYEKAGYTAVEPLI